MLVFRWGVKEKQAILYWHHMTKLSIFIMEPLAIIGLILFVIEEILPFIPAKILPANGIIHGIIGALRTAFPKPRIR